MNIAPVSITKGVIFRLDIRYTTVLHMHSTILCSSPTYCRDHYLSLDHELPRPLLIAIIARADGIMIITNTNTNANACCTHEHIRKQWQWHAPTSHHGPWADTPWIGTNPKHPWMHWRHDIQCNVASNRPLSRGDSSKCFPRLIHVGGGIIYLKYSGILVGDGSNCFRDVWTRAVESIR